MQGLATGAPSSSAIMQPAAHTSTAGPYDRAPNKSSGARYLRKADGSA